MDETVCRHETQVSTTGQPKNFCELLNGSYGPIWIPVEVQNQRFIVLQRPTEPVELSEQIDNGESIPLWQVLTTYKLTAKMKLVMAYILSHSVWRYYHSDWMKRPWSPQSIHFMKKKAVDESGNHKISICNPCFAIDFSENPEEVSEYYYQALVAHNYPRMLALGNMLVEIGRHPDAGRVETTVHPNLVTQINSDLAQGISTLRSDKNWPYLDSTFEGGSVKDIYKEITGRCFDLNLFESPVSRDLPRERYGKSATKDDKTEGFAEERRGILYQKLVAPLRDLLVRLGWEEAVTHIETMEATVLDFQDRPKSEAKAVELRANKTASSMLATTAAQG